jgi:hypothetical protein
LLQQNYPTQPRQTALPKIVVGSWIRIFSHAPEIARIKMKFYISDKEGFTNFIFKKNQVEIIFEVFFFKQKLLFKNYLSNKKLNCFTSLKKPHRC